MMTQISVQDLKDKHQNLGTGEVILDVRTIDEFAEGHIPGAINIPLDQISTAVERLKKYQSVYIHCRSGRRAQTAYEQLKNAGLSNLHCLSDGGMLDWLAHGYPVK